ncbi:pyruvate, water dikinase regulatory protein [Staphylococcus simulans]|uniref:pyruvate, water dikinase regulatory protein n=1 Tax=Staphylococcus simulans TaxID=1286 RepID=UPI00399A45B7
MQNNNEHLALYIVSDSIGETAQRMIHATLTQFPDMEDDVEIKKFPFIKNEEEFLTILKLAKQRDAIVITTLVNPKFNQIGQAYAEEQGLQYVDYMTDLLNLIENKTHKKALRESGALRKMDQHYFERIEAMEFSVKYDDGKVFTGIEEADAVILGVSRTSKTPLSMYLANKGYKIANIPLVPEAPIPEEVFNKKMLVFGLTASPDYIMNIRTERIRVLGMKGSANYNSLQRIKKELSYAEEVFDKFNAIVINTEYKSIEESAFYIEKYLNN